MGHGPERRGTEFRSRPCPTQAPSTSMAVDTRRVVERPGPEPDELLLEPVFAAKFSDVVTSLGIGVVFGRVHQIASDV